MCFVPPSTQHNGGERLYMSFALCLRRIDSYSIIAKYATSVRLLFKENCVLQNICLHKGKAKRQPALKKIPELTF